MVTLEGTNKFYSRGTNGKYLMAVGEIEQFYRERFGAEKENARLRDECIDRVINKSGDCKVVQGPVLIVQMLPNRRLDVSEHGVLSQDDFRNGPSLLLTEPSTATVNAEPNFWGHIQYLRFHHTEEVDMYCQVYFDGGIEFVDTNVFIEKRYFVAKWFEDRLAKKVAQYLSLQQQMTVAYPISLWVSMLGMKGCYLEVGYPESLLSRRLQPGVIRQDQLICPPLLITEAPADMAQLLRPIFDAIWRSAGWERSTN